MKTLGPLVRKISDVNMTKVINALTTHMYNLKKSELREISNIGLKGVIQDVDDVLGEKVSEQLVPKLLSGLKSDSPPEVVQESLDILADLLVRFGASVAKDLPQLQKAILPQLESARQVTKKRATQCLTQVAKHAPDALFNELVETLVAQLKTGKPANKRIYIQAVGSLARSVYHRIGKYIATISPLLRQAVESGKADADEDIKENVLQTFEAFVLRCRKDVAPELKSILDMALKLLSFDPNFAGDEEGDEEGDGEEDGSFGSDEDDGDAEADDESWKVRRAAAKTLSAVIVTHPEMAASFWASIAPLLIKRFSEREESVRLDVFATFNDLARQTASVSKGTGQAGVLSHLQAAVPLILKPICTHLKDSKSIKTRQGAVGVVREVATALPGCFAPHVDALVPGLLVVLSDKPTKNLQLKLEGLSLVRLLLTTSPSGTFSKHLSALLPLVADAAKDQYFKVVSEALRVCAALVIAAGPQQADFVVKVYGAIQPQMQALDIDQAVKEAAIAAAAVVVATVGSKTPDLPNVLKTLADRLNNEITRSAAVAAIGVIAEAKVDISSVLADCVKKLASFMRKSNRALKTSSIHSLSSLVVNYGKNKEFSGLHVVVIEELSRQVTDADLQLSQLTLSLAVRVLESDPDSAKTVKELLYPQVLALIQSSLLQGQALDAVTMLLARLVSGNYAAFSFKEMLDSLLGLATGNKLAKQNYLSIGRCVSALVLNTTQAADATATVKRFISDVTSGSDQVRLVSLYCLGDIGRKSDLSAYGDLRDVLSKLLDYENEEIRAAASYALGSIAVGNLAAFLPSILKDIHSSKRQYLLLHSIREIIADAPAAALQPHLEVITSLLFENSKSEDDGTRNVVAECLGKLAPVNPKVLVPALQAHLKDANADTRATIVSAFKFAVVEHADAILEEALANATEDVLNCLNDAQVEVRRAALRTINFIIHNKPSLVRHKLGKHLPALYAQTAIKKELIREVDLGPFKHRVDDGLDTRKAAFECMYTLLERLPGVVAVADFVQPLVSGMDDEQEIKLQSYLIIVRLALVAGTSLLEVLEQLLEPVKKEIKKKVDKSAIAQAQERQLELKRSALRAVAAIASVHGADLKDVVECINAAGLKELYDSVLADMITAGDLNN